MGSYNSWKLTAQAHTNEDISAIKNSINTVHTDDGVFDFIWNRFSEPSKWWPEIELLKREVSKQHPKIMFCLECHGEIGHWRMFILNGESCYEGDMVFRWPTKSTFKAGIKHREQLEIQKKVAVENAVKEKKQQQLIELKKQQEALEAELNDSSNS